MAEIGRDVGRAIALLKAGEIVAIPTETVYGLAACISSDTAVRKIFEAKQRPFTDPLIVHVASVDGVGSLVTDFPDMARKLMEAFSPGPLTILLPKSQLVSDLVTNNSPLVAIRIPAHPLALELLRELGEPIAAPSANPFGGISPTSAEHVQMGLGAKIPYILDGGDCGIGLESTIVKIEENGKIRILRQGGISQEELQLFVSLELEVPESSETVVPGSMLSHYAPRKPLYLIEGEMKANPENIGWLRFNTLLPEVSPENQIVLSPSGDLKEAGRNLFSALHQLDSMSVDEIRAERMPNHGIGRAINDRLFRASVKRA
jgi:L-threonylcarbamoyladenylate synthase